MENGRGLAVFASVVALLSAAAFVAAGRLLRGSDRARQFLLAAWLIDFALLRVALSGNDSPLYWVPAFGAGLYTLYVLLFRRDAAKRVSATGMETGKGAKIILGCIVVPLLAFSLLYTHSTVGTWKNSHFTTSSFQSSSSGTIMPYIEKAYFIQVSPDETALKLCGALAENLRKELGLPTEVIPYGTLTLRFDLDREKVFAVLSCEPIPPPKQELPVDLPEKIRRELAKSLAQPNPMPNVGDNFWAKGRSRHGFRVFTPSLRYSATYAVQNLCFANLAAQEMDMQLAISSRGATANKIVGEAAKTFTNQFLKALRPMRAPEAMRLPHFGLAPEEPPKLDGLQPILLGSGMLHGFFTLFAFNEKAALQDAETALTQRGFTREKHDVAGDIVFLGKNGLRACISSGRNWGEPKMRQKTNTLTIGRERLLKSIDPDVLERFKREEPRSFASAGGLWTLKGGELSAFFDRVAALPLTFPEKQTILSYTENEEGRKVLGERRSYLFHSMLEETLRALGREGFPKRIDSLFSLAKKMPETEQTALKERLAPFLVPCAIPETPNADGIRTLDLDIPREELIGTPIILEISTPGFDAPPLLFPFSLTRVEDGTFLVESVNSTQRGIGNPAGMQENTVCYLHGGWGPATFSSGPPPLLQKHQNDQLQINIRPNTEKKCFEIRLSLRPKMDETSTEIK